MPSPSLSYLNELYRDADTVDREVFAEYRQSILLIAGEHYSKRKTEEFNQSRSTKDVGEKTKLRITKNHAHKVQRYYVDTTIDYAPDVAILPQNPLELQDKKSAEMYQAVWGYLKPQIRFRESRREWCESFVGTGEVAVKIFWDPDKGQLLGYEPKMNDDGTEEYETGESGEFLLDAMGNPTPIPDKTKPVFKGQFVVEHIPSYNLLRSSEAKKMRDAECLIVRKMLSTKKLKLMYADDPDKLKFIKSSSDDEFVVFDSSVGGYYKTKDQTLVKEFYFPVCRMYPEGWYAIAVDGGILEEGPLPQGIFPIIWQGFDTADGSPRGRGIIKVARSYIHEINRASSSQALHQITLGDDKVLYQAGAKLSQGSLLPGVRGITFQGLPPTVLPGRDGSQYSGYIKDTIAELYDNLMIGMTNRDKNTQLDPISLLFATAMQRKDFAKYAEKFEIFLCEVVETLSELAKYYLPDDELVYAAGKREFINIAEFRNVEPLRTQIKLDPTTETLEMRLGKYLTGMSVMQYVGNKLERQDIGRLVSDLPFGSFAGALDDLTLDSRCAENDILAMERGTKPITSPFENHDYMAKRLVDRMKAPDFFMLAQEVQQLFSERLAEHQAAISEQEQKLMAAKNEFIPVDGGLVRADMYVQKKDDPTKTERAAIPQRALEWLIKRLEEQGMSLDKMQDMNKGQLAQLASMLVQGGQSAQPMGQQPAPGMVQ